MHLSANAPGGMLSVVSDTRELYHTIRRTIRRRQNRRVMFQLLDARGPLPENRFTAAIYFADTTVNMYQIRQWYAPMVELAKTQPVVVIARNVATTRLLLEECPLPVFYGPTIAVIEEWTATQPIGAVFYVNQNMRNFQMMRFPKPAHVFVCHGESDKSYMASNQLKAYDYTFIAGDAARERIANRLIDFDVDTRLIEVGRPQVDVDYPGPELPSDGRTVVLYAPTWEGDRPSMTYSSVSSHGPQMLPALLSNPRYRVIYRPHPRTGAFDPTYKQVHKDLVTMIESANANDPSAHHMVDTETAFGWHLKQADVCIADISAVAFDWLATGKPLLLTEPASPEADVDRSGIAGLLPTLDAGRAPDVIEEITEVSSGSTSQTAAVIAHRYFGDTTPGASMTRFLNASIDLVNQRLT